MPMSSPDKAALGLSASTVIKATPGKVFNVNVTTAGVAGALYDCATVGAAAAGNLIATVPAVVGPVALAGFPFNVGLVYVPGAGQIASVAYY